MSGIDFSDEGLAGRVEGVEPEAVEETPEPEVQDAPEAVEPEAVEEEPAAEEEPADEDPEPQPEPEAEAPSEWQVRYDEAQKVIGRQGQELGELRRMMEEFQAAQQQAPAEDYDTGPFVGREPQTAHDLLEMAASPDEAIDAYRFAVERAPDLIPDVLAEVQMHDPGLAKRMELDLYQAMVQAQVAPVQEAYHQTSQDQQAASVVDEYAAQVDGWTEIKDEVAKIIEEEPWLVGDGSPQAIQQGLRAATRMAQQARAVATQHAEAQAQQQRVQQRQAAAVETGTPSAAPTPTEVSEADAIRNAIFEEDKRRRAIHD